MKGKKDNGRKEVESKKLLVVKSVAYVTLYAITFALFGSLAIEMAEQHTPQDIVEWVQILLVVSLTVVYGWFMGVSTWRVMEIIDPYKKNKK